MDSLQTRALQHIWFPCSQMKDYETLSPIQVKQAYGSTLLLEDGREIIDAISSWWCKSLGHRHPRLQRALMTQLEKFEHIIGTNTVNETLTQLSETLSTLHPGLDKVFYASDGSMAVEIALKMSLHAHQLQGNTNRKRFISLQNGYHGETLATLSLSDLGIYKAPYQDHCFECTHIRDIPYVQSTDDPLWHDTQSIWPSIEKQLLPLRHTASAIIVEPILQGAGGMKIYSADFLNRLGQFAKENNIHLICDEIMTGLGRTGKTLAIDHTNVQADFLCLSKALTGGNVPMSAMLTSTDIYDLFYDDYHSGKAFLHSNTYAGNALAASVANEVLAIHTEDNMSQCARSLGESMNDAMKAVAHETKCLINVRHIGAMVSAEIDINTPRPGFKLFQASLDRGAFIRPIGNTLYWLPPLNTAKKLIEKLATITIEAINHVKSSE